MPNDTDVFDLGDIEPVTKPVTIRRDGKLVTLDAWFEGDGCPVDVLIAVSAIRSRYNRARRENPDDHDEAWFIYRRDLLRAVVPALTEPEVAILAASPTRGVALLQHLDWFAKPAEVAETPVPEAVGGVESTMDDSSPDSAASTPGTPSMASAA